MLNNNELFNLGQTVMTAGVSEYLESEGLAISELYRFVFRHHTGDWGELSEEDINANNVAVENGDERILSAYSLNGTKIWIITEADRSVTTVLFPEEY